jgi:hypothetical protein
MKRYPEDRLTDEVALIAVRFHWPYTEIMALDHRERLRWIAALQRIQP